MQPSPLSRLLNAGGFSPHLGDTAPPGGHGSARQARPLPGAEPPSPAPDAPLLPSAAWSQTTHTGREPSAKLPLPPPLHSLRLSLLLEVASRSTQSTLPSKLLLSRAVWMRHLQRHQQNTLACMGLPGPRRERSRTSPRGRHIPDAAPQPLLHKGRPLNVKSQACLLKSLLSPATWGRKLFPSRPNPTAACPQAQRGHRGLQQRPLLYVRVTRSTGTLQNPGPSVPAVSHRGQGTEGTHRRSEHGMLGASLPRFPQLGEPEHSPWSCEEADPSRSGGEGRSAAPQLFLNKTTGSDETTSHR